MSSTPSQVPWIIKGPYHLWFHIARIREANGDTSGAARARQNARMLSNREMFQKFSASNYPVSRP